MTFQLDARVTLFPWINRHLVHRPGLPFTIPAEWRHRFDGAQALATVQWSAEGSLGVPIAPYLVELASPEIALGQIETDAGSFNLHGGNGFAKSFATFIRSISDGLLYLRGQITATADGDIFATDLTGSEVEGTRLELKANVPQNVILLGPHIEAIRSTVPLTIAQVRFVTLPLNDEYRWIRMAEVAPALDAIPAYRPQAYLGRYDYAGVLQTPLSAADALQARLDADALARANTLPPAHGIVDRDVHRAPPGDGADTVLRSDFVAQLVRYQMELFAVAAWEYQGKLPVAGGGEVDATIRPARILQFLAATGSIESCALGAGVTIPVPTPRFTSPIELGRDHEWTPESQLPVPIVRVTGYFAPKEGFVSSDIETNRISARRVTAYGHLTWARTMAPAVASVIARRAPEGRDLPAKGDVELACAEPSRGDALFLERRARADAPFELLRAALGPKMFFPSDVNPPDPPGRLSRVVDPGIDLPLMEQSEARYRLHRRTRAGQWFQPTEAPCALAPWTVASPVMIKAEVEYAGDFGVFLSITFGWNWGIRSPEEIRFGLMVGSRVDEESLTSVLPADGMTSPGLGQRNPLRLLFSGDPDVTPRVEFLPPPRMPKPTIAIVAETHPEGNAVGQPFDRSTFAQRTYRLRVKLGDSDLIFRASERGAVSVVADAVETVSGTRRSAPSSRLLQEVLDPRPPQITDKPWELVWASRPNPANESRATLALPEVSKGLVSRFAVWRTHESQLAARMLEIRPDFLAPMKSLLREPNMQVRLVWFEELYRQLLATGNDVQRKLIEVFAADQPRTTANGSMEIEVPGGQTGLEFFIFTAISRTGVSSEKALLPTVRGVAVPPQRVIPRPALRVLSVDDEELLKLSGTLLLIVSSSEPFAPSNVRIFRDDRADADPEEMLSEMRPIWPVSAAAARAYVADIDAVLARQPFFNRQLFLTRPPRRWAVQALSADIQGVVDGSPGSEIPSPRSAAAQFFVPPATRPRLEVETHERAVGHQWRLNVNDLPIISPLGASEVLLEYRDGGSMARDVRSTTWLLQNELVLTPAPGRIGTRFSSTGTLDVSTDFLPPADAVLRIVAEDPKGRSCDIRLSFEIP